MNMQQRAERMAAIDRALRDLVASAEAQLVRRLEMSAVDVPEMFASVAGLIGDVPIRLTARRFKGKLLESLTIVTVETLTGTMMSVGIIGIPAFGFGIPVLGIDAISTRTSLSLAAVDLPATDTQSGRFDEWFAPLLLQLCQRTHDITRSRHRPEDAADHACTASAWVVASRKGHEADTLLAVQEFISQFVDVLIGNAERLRIPDSETAANAYARSVKWRRREMEYREQTGAMAGIFGQAYAMRLLRDFLFVVPPKPA